MEVADGVDDSIRLAIIEGARAGKYRAAARLIPRSAAMYSSAADVFHERVATLLDDAMDRLGVEGPWPDLRDDMRRA